MLGLRTERLIFFSRIFNNLTAIGPELTKNKRNLKVFRSHINNSKQTFSVFNLFFSLSGIFHLKSSEIINNLKDKNVKIEFFSM